MAGQSVGKWQGDVSGKTQRQAWLRGHSTEDRGTGLCCARVPVSGLALRWQGAVSGGTRRARSAQGGTCTGCDVVVLQGTRGVPEPSSRRTSFIIRVTGHGQVGGGRGCRF